MALKFNNSEKENMKKLAKLLLVGALSLGSLQAKELFNLKAQDFQHTLENKQVNAKYKVNDIIVETNLIKHKEDGAYSKVGYLNLESINPLQNWTLNIDFKFGTGGSNYQRLIKLIDENGTSFVMEFSSEGFNINGKKFKADIGNQLLFLNISMKGNTLKIKLNNQNLMDDNVKFDKLKFVDMNTNGSTTTDRINNTILVSHD